MKSGKTVFLHRETCFSGIRSSARKYQPQCQMTEIYHNSIVVFLAAQGSANCNWRGILVLWRFLGRQQRQRWQLEPTSRSDITTMTTPAPSDIRCCNSSCCCLCCLCCRQNIARGVLNTTTGRQGNPCRPVCLLSFGVQNHTRWLMSSWLHHFSVPSHSGKWKSRSYVK